MPQQDAAKVQVEDDRALDIKPVVSTVYPKPVAREDASRHIEITKKTS